MAHLKSRSRDLIASTACLVMLLAVAWIALDATDPAVQLQQTDLYRQDLFRIPLDDGATATQGVEAAALTRVDVLAQASDPSPLRLRVYEDGAVIREETVTVPATEFQDFVAFIFPLIEGPERDLELRFDSPRETGAPGVYGATCDCLDGGSLDFDPGRGIAAPTLQDLHLGTFTVKSRGERLDLVLERAVAYAPGWLGTGIFAAAALAVLLLAALLTGMTIATATREYRRRTFAATVIVIAAGVPLVAYLVSPS